MTRPSTACWVPGRPWCPGSWPRCPSGKRRAPESQRPLGPRPPWSARRIESVAPCPPRWGPHRHGHRLRCGPPGTNLCERGQLVAVALTQQAAIRAGTLGAAEWRGLAQERGSVELGQQAHLVLTPMMQDGRVVKGSSGACNTARAGQCATRPARRPHCPDSAEGRTRARTPAGGRWARTYPPPPTPAPRRPPRGGRPRAVRP